MTTNYLTTGLLLKKVATAFFLTLIAFAAVNAQSPCAFVPQNIVLSSTEVPANATGTYTPAGTYNGAPQWTSPGTPGEGELFTIRWTGSQWEIVYNKYGTFATNNSGSITSLPCTGWGGFGALTLSGGCGSLVNPDAPVVGISPSSQTIISGQSATLTASGADTYLWDISPASSNTTVSVSPTQTTVYSVTGTSNGCTGTASATVTVLCAPPTQYTVTGGGSYCTDGSGVAIGLSNSESGVTYQLKLGNTNSGTAIQGTNSAISFGSQTNTGIYTVEAARTSDGCSSTMTGNATITVNTSPTVTINPSATTITGGDTFSLTASGAASYTWNTGSNTTVLTGSPSKPTTYTVLGMDQNGCIGEASATVSVTCNPAITAKATSVTQTAVLGPDNCSVALKGAGFGTGFVFTGPGGYVFSAVYRRVGSYTINGLNVTQPGTYTLKTSYTNACGETSDATMTYVATGEACK